MPKDNMFIEKNELFLLEEVVRKNFAAKYKDSVLGIFWSLLKPLCIMAIMTAVFATIFTGMIENFPVYMLAGRCFYDFFSGGVGVSLMAIKGNKNILQKTAAPKHIFIIGSVISEFLNFLITLIILVGVMIVTNASFHFAIMPMAIIPIAILVLMVLGLSFILAIVCVYYTDIQHLWTVVSLLFMYASAIFYPMEIIPEPYYSLLMNYNPLLWVITQFRQIIMYGVMPDMLNVINSLLISLMLLIIGIIIFKKYEKRTTLKF